MRIYFAPMEGFTDGVFRRVHRRMFPGVKKYFMPFISPSASLAFTKREMEDLSPAMNAGVPAVPQVLARHADYFLGAARMLRDMGYPEVNLNLGCPSGTVTGKGKGAGFLRDTEGLARFLDAVFARSPLPISVKSRIGMESEEEWPRVLSVLTRYPFTEWLLHPRTGKEQYRGTPRRSCYRQAASCAPFPVLYNGDLFTASDAWDFLLSESCAPGLVLGRGILTNPALAREISGGEPLTLPELAAFHDALLREYLSIWPESAAVGRMHAILQYFSFSLEFPAPLLRAAKRATALEAYTDGVAALFAQSALKRPPRFIPPI